MAAGSALTVFLGLLLLSTLSWARTPVDLPAADDSNYDSFSESGKNSAVANTIFLPSHRSESQSETVIQSEPEIPDSKISKPDPPLETLESTESSEASDRAPITVISFRPLNRHIPRRPLPFPSRLGHRCRHNHEFKPWNPRLPRRQIPYGNDMILSNGEDRSFDVMAGDSMRQIPIRWTRFRRVDPRFFDEPGMESEVMRRPHHHHHHHDHDHEHDREHEHEDEHERDHKDGSLMKKIRKFLHHF